MYEQPYVDRDAIHSLAAVHLELLPTVSVKSLAE